MATEHTRDPQTPLIEGEFQRIPGIGPGIAQRLRAAGIQTFRHLASLTPEEICGLLNGLVGMTPERIAHQDWPGKARQLAQEIATTEPPSEPEDPGERQHYASFMIELLQDDNHRVRRTRVTHVQGGERNSWAGWDAGRLDAWIVDQAGIAIPRNTPDPALQESPVSEPKLLAVKKRVEKPSLPGGIDIDLGASEIFSPGSERSVRFITAGHPFEIHLPIDAGPKMNLQTPLLYRATVQVRPSGGQCLQVAEIQGQCEADGPDRLIIPVEGLPEGTYRVETTLLMYPAEASQPEKEGRHAFSEGGLVHVFPHET